MMFTMISNLQSGLAMYFKKIYPEHQQSPGVIRDRTRTHGNTTAKCPSSVAGLRSRDLYNVSHDKA